MRSVTPHPCIGSSCSALSTSMSSVPWRRSPRSFATALPSTDERRLNAVPFDCQGDGTDTTDAGQSNVVACRLFRSDRILDRMNRLATTINAELAEPAEKTVLFCEFCEFCGFCVECRAVWPVTDISRG